MSRFDPTPEEMVWAREWAAKAAVDNTARHADEFVLIGVRVWLDDAAKEAAAGNDDEADKSVRRARALIAALAEFRGAR